MSEDLAVDGEGLVHLYYGPDSGTSPPLVMSETRLLDVGLGVVDVFWDDDWYETTIYTIDNGWEDEVVTVAFRCAFCKKCTPGAPNAAIPLEGEPDLYEVCDDCAEKLQERTG